MRLEQARLHVVAEDDRASQLQTRAATIAAAAGVILGLTITIGRTLFSREIDEGTFEPIYLATLAVLLISGFLAGLALWPPATWAAEVEEVEDYANPALAEDDPEHQALDLIGSLTYQLAETRNSNDSKTRILRWSLGIPAVGVLGASFLGATLALAEPEQKRDVSQLSEP